jgi:EAL domain-containing protein (putative c-di-GMP-specific phosphodiesterase class I)
MTTTEGTPLTSAVDLLHAIDEQRLLVHYQGIFEPRTRALRGAEALVRWDHEELGLLGPAAFLPTDMSGGLGWALTNFVIEEAVRQCGAWRRGGLDIGVSVNISPGRLADDVLPVTIADLLAREGVPAAALTVEITEHRCSIDPVGIRRALVALARLGVRLSLDDFGTGESSLSRLRQLQFDELKIDRQFVTDVATDPTDRNIVRFATGLGHDLGSKVVAEGIETEAALEATAALGVDLAQGYLLHRPAAAGDVPWV